MKIFSHLQMTFAISKELQFLAVKGFRVKLTRMGIVPYPSVAFFFQIGITLSYRMCEATCR